MVTLAQLPDLLTANPQQEFRCDANLNLYDAPTRERLATQAVLGRHLRITRCPTPGDAPAAIAIELCEDNYPGWLAAADLAALSPAIECYRPIALTRAEIFPRLPQVITFARAAMRQPNTYLWGGTVGPNYDCSGLIQSAFAAQGIWLPRDAYQQEAFVQPIALEDAAPGDLVFFGSSERCTHVGLYLGDRRYLHSSGKSQGRNGIGVDVLAATGDAVSQTYWQQFRGVGRVTRSYGALASAGG